MGIYEELGVKRLINAWGTVTRVGGSIMSPRVLEAMTEASEAFVDIDELLLKAGARIAKITGAEAAFITSGAAAGMAVAAAACIAGTDRAKIERLPCTEGMKNQIVTMRSHRVLFDQAMRLAGAELVEVGYPKHSFPSQLEAALNEKTAAVFYLIEADAYRGSLPLTDVIAIAKKTCVPVIVNAAAELPPADNLRKFTGMGADLVIFSGGKDIRGPQNTGLILGRGKLIEACALNSNPNYSIGRPMKVSKEAIAGLLRALELYVEQDFDTEMKEWEKQVLYFIAELSELPYLSVRKGFPTQPSIQPACIPRAYVEVDEKRLGTNAAEIVSSLREGTPGILVEQMRGGFILNPQMLEKGEAEVVVRRVKEVIQALAKQKD